MTLVKIHAMAHGGEGVGRPVDATADDGQRVWFIAGALPGEVVVANPQQVRKRFTRGVIDEVREPSDARVRPPCAKAEVCGGCNWQHVNPQMSLQLKRSIVADQLRKLHVHVVAHPGPMGPALGYRRRARMHYKKTAEGGLSLGFHRHHSDEIVDLDTCPVLEPVLAAAMLRVRTLADHFPATGAVVGLTDGTRVVLGLPGVRPTPEIAAACERLLDDTLVGIELRGGRERADIGQTQLDIDEGALPPVRANAFAFAQASRGPNASLVEHVTRVAKAAGKRVLEGYAGSGNLTRALAQTARSVWAMESEREAVTRLEGLAEATGLPIKVRRANLERVLPRMARKLAEERRNRGYDVVVVDPPRRGLGKDVAHALTKLARERIVIVSCDPATLARDLQVMVANGFAIRHVTVFDLMPMTSEVEVVAMLERRPG